VEGLQPEEMTEEVRAGRKRKADGVCMLCFSNHQVMSKPLLCHVREHWDLQGEQYARLSSASLKLLEV